MMKKLFADFVPTLRLKWPFGRRLGVALLLLIGSAGGCEWLSRLDALQAYLPPESVGAGHLQMDKKITLLNAMVRREGGVDCIFMGSSMMVRGVDPEVFRSAYLERTGKRIRCFNFGLAGVAETGSAPLAEILIGMYHPGLLILGTSPGNLDDVVGAELSEKLLSNPWVRYRLGHFNLDGALIDRSAAFRHFIGRNYLPGLKDPVRQLLQGRGIMTDYGFAVIDKSQRPNTLRNQRKLAQLKISSRQLAALERFLRLNSRVEILALEMPVSQEFIQAFDRNRSGVTYQQALDVIARIAGKCNVPFWLTTPRQIVPAEVWIDTHHLKLSGAEIFSRWLGGQVGEAVRQGRLKDPGR